MTNQDAAKRFTTVQPQPITEIALIERMTTEATTWINAVHRQCSRVADPYDDADQPNQWLWQLEIDLHFLITALYRLRRAVRLTDSIGPIKPAITGLLSTFDQQVPSLKTLRDVAEHFDDYTIGAGRNNAIKRHQLQVWIIEEGSHGLVWRWLDIEFNVSTARDAATQLYDGFLDSSDQQSAKRPM